MCEIGENVENAVCWAVLYTDKIYTELRHVSSFNLIIAKGSSLAFSSSLHFSPKIHGLQNLACFLFCQLEKDLHNLQVVTSSIISCYTKGTTFINARRMLF